MVDLEAKRAGGKAQPKADGGYRYCLPAVRLFFPGEIGRSLFRSLYRHAEKHYRAEKCGKEAEREKGLQRQVLAYSKTRPILDGL